MQKLTLVIVLLGLSVALVSSAAVEMEEEPSSTSVPTTIVVTVESSVVANENSTAASNATSNSTAMETQGRMIGGEANVKGRFHHHHHHHHPYGPHRHHHHNHHHHHHCGFHGNAEHRCALVCHKHGDGLHPISHRHCDQRFCQCHAERSWVQHCGPGTVFNPNCQCCDYPQNVCHRHHIY